MMKMNSKTLGECRNMCKRFLLLISIVALMVLTACSSGGDSSLASGKTTIKYAYWDKKQEGILKEQVKAFNEEYPDINVKLELTPFDQYWTKLDAAASGGELPDVFWMNGPNFIKYASNDVIEPLDKYISDDDFDLSPYPDALLDLYNNDGKQYAFPRDFDTNGLWYNKEMFDDAGLDYPDDDWEWEDLVEASKKLTDPSKDIYGIAAHINSGQSSHWNIIFANDGYVLSDDKKESGFDDPNTVDALEKYYDLIDKYEVSPTQAQMETTEPVSMFESGKVAMIYLASYYVPEFRENEYTNEHADVTSLPKLKQKSNVIHGLGNVVASNSKNKDAAWKFVQFLGSEEAGMIQSENGLLSAYEGTQDNWIEATPEFNLQVFLDAEDYAEPYPVSKDTAKWHTIMQDDLAKAWSGQLSVEEVSKKIAEQMEDVLANE